MAGSWRTVSDGKEWQRWAARNAIQEAATLKRFHCEKTKWFCWLANGRVLNYQSSSRDSCQLSQFAFFCVCFVCTKELLAVDKTCVSVWVSGNLKKSFHERQNSRKIRRKRKLGERMRGVKIKWKTGEKNKKKQQWFGRDHGARCVRGKRDRKRDAGREMKDRQTDRQTERAVRPSS